MPQGAAMLNFDLFTHNGRPLAAGQSLSKAGTGVSLKAPAMNGVRTDFVQNFDCVYIDTVSYEEPVYAWIIF